MMSDIKRNYKNTKLQAGSLVRCQGSNEKMIKFEVLERAITGIKSIMLAYATDGRSDEQPQQYQDAYIDLDLLIEEAGYSNPNSYKTIEQFWKACGGTWASRLELIGDIYADLLFDIGRKKKKLKEPRNWKNANDVLTDKLFPIRSQWLKAKNFIFTLPPDYENSIKESVNSIESCLMILLSQPKGTLGKLIKNQKIDTDIGKIISQVYGLCSNKDFVRHGGIQNQSIGKFEAEFFLDFAASAIIYIIGKLSESPNKVN